MQDEKNHSVQLSEVSLSTLYQLVSPYTVTYDESGAKSVTFPNWSKTFVCRPLAAFAPRNAEECRMVFELARREGKCVRVVGALHSPSDLACTTDFMLLTHNLNKLIEVNADKRFVVVEGGMSLTTLQKELSTFHLSMRNQPSISTQAIGGIIATATHGTGINFKVLSADVISLSILLADGSIVSCSREMDRDLFLATLCGLGTTGLILTVKLQVEPAFRLREEQVTLPFDTVMGSLDDLVLGSQHVRLWWYPQSRSVRVSSANRTLQVADPSTTRKSLLHDILVHHFVEFLLFIARFIPFVTFWIARYVSYMESAPKVLLDDSAYILNMNCRFPQYTIEWAIPFDKTRECLLELRSWLEREHADPNGHRPHFPIEIRFSDEDDIWMSPSNGRKTCWIGIIQYKPYGFPVRYRELFRRFEKIVDRYGGRPHWAKPHRLGPTQLREKYTRFDDFIGLLEKVDPHGMFRNQYVRRHLYGEDGVDSRMFKQYQRHNQ